MRPFYGTLAKIGTIGRLCVDSCRRPRLRVDCMYLREDGPLR